jgi:hypothetical protein
MWITVFHSFHRHGILTDRIFSIGTLFSTEVWITCG